MKIGNKRLKVQHKQIRQSENNPGQLQQEIVPEPSTFPADGSVASGNANVDWTGNETVDQNHFSATGTDSKPPSIPDVTEENDSSPGNGGAKLPDLKSIREALPDVQ